jgi:acyl carrier protein
MNIEELMLLLKNFLDSRAKAAAYDLHDRAELGIDLGLDSLDKVDLLLFVEKELKISIDPDRSSGIETVEDLLRLVNDGLGASGGGAARGLGISDLERHLIHEVPQFLNEVEQQQGRSLTIGGKTVFDFASANYLGLDLDRRIFSQIQKDLERWGTHPSWTRAIASPLPYNQLERTLAEMVRAPGVLVFPTVTLIHMGVLPLLAGQGTLFLMDERAHKSIQEGAALGRAKGASTKFFKHNDLEDLRSELDSARNFDAVYICVDGVFSMTGDEAKIVDMVAICRDYPNATLYVDDAHGFGILGSSPDAENPYGSGGGGLLRKHGVDVERDKVIYVAALSKSFSSLAAFITCRDMDEREHFSTASTFVNSGPCPTASLSSAQTGLNISQSSEGDSIRRVIYDLTKRFVDGVRDVGLVVVNEGYFPLVSVEIGSIAAVTDAAKILWDRGILITPAVYPNAPIKRSMLRFTFTAANTAAEIDAAIEALEVVRDQIPSAPYN